MPDTANVDAAPTYVAVAVFGVELLTFVVTLLTVTKGIVSVQLPTVTAVTVPRTDGVSGFVPNHPDHADDVQVMLPAELENTKEVPGFSVMLNGEFGGSAPPLVYRMVVADAASAAPAMAAIDVAAAMSARMRIAGLLSGPWRSAPVLGANRSLDNPSATSIDWERVCL
ncbi:MAG TPA: hypothetical protein VGW75_12360 [Solirubrobacteraceae bacterium]|nr:hypothetical protein [Solirubrobacteraceae bacterium]